MMDSPAVVTGDSEWEQTHMVQIEIEDKKHGEISPCFIFHQVCNPRLYNSYSPDLVIV